MFQDRTHRGSIDFEECQQSQVSMGHAVLIKILNRRLYRVTGIDGHSASRPGLGACLFQIVLRRQLAIKEACHQVIAVELQSPSM